ncbi:MULTISPECIES: hypothetical protein [Halorussus]|uniref:hypothetical protein n=1 Tax=Halorussus TaxID=1070314 RepID=UPI00209D7D0B|nr:hypothetical protein [Halorussus vallis]USZ78647.1 hypothetical protein NGM07_25190 [Halorussus vallis]USZ78678.1 hypothetical protein NGM07_24520 [Halorussus vallis]
MRVIPHCPENERDFIEVRDGLASHFFTVLSPNVVRFTAFGGEKPLGEPHLPTDIKSLFTKHGIAVV